MTCRRTLVLIVVSKWALKELVFEEFSLFRILFLQKMSFHKATEQQIRHTYAESVGGGTRFLYLKFSGFHLLSKKHWPDTFERQIDASVERRNHRLYKKDGWRDSSLKVKPKPLDHPLVACCSTVSRLDMGQAKNSKVHLKNIFLRDGFCNFREFLSDCCMFNGLFIWKSSVKFAN